LGLKLISSTQPPAPQQRAGGFYGLMQLFDNPAVYRNGKGSKTNNKLNKFIPKGWMTEKGQEKPEEKTAENLEPLSVERFFLAMVKSCQK
jgi:hypothetical protein